MAAFKTNSEAAIYYANIGWQVFPCHSMSEDLCSCDRECKSPGKHPMTRDGFKSATNDQDTIREWWDSTPRANIGMATGSASGVWALDLDGSEGIRALEEWQSKFGPVPRTPTARTGGGGKHLFFRMLEGTDIRNRTKIQGKKIDVRGTDGYVILPPSNHASGSCYEWEVSPGDADVAEAPEWLIDFVSSKNAPVPGDGPDRDFQDVTGALDLETDPGAPEGKRHDTATRLIGSHLGRGEGSLSVYLKALEWGQRCAPQMEEEEILRIVQDLAKKDAAKWDVGKLIDEPANDAPWPTLSPAALHGLAGDIVRAIEPHTEADDVAILVQLLTFLGCVIGRLAHFMVEATRHHCNLFAVLVAETGKGRKGTSADRIKELFQWVDEDWLRHKVIGGLSSGEGLIVPVRDASVKKEPIREGGKTSGKIASYQDVIVDHGVKDKRLLIVESEFSSVFSMIKREGNILSQMIREAWDSGNLGKLTKTNLLRATDAHISIVGHITREELLRRMADVELFNGFANRFLWLCVKRSKLLPDGGGAVDLTPFIARLADVVGFATRVERMSRDAAACELWAKIYRALDRPLGGTLGAVTNRAEAQILRLSLVYALLDKKAIIEPMHLDAALAVWQYAEDSARYIFGNSTGDTLADRLLALIREKPGLTNKDIHNATGKNHTADRLQRALKELVRLKLIRREKDKSTGGRPAEKWYPAE